MAGNTMKRGLGLIFVILLLGKSSITVTPHERTFLTIFEQHLVTFKSFVNQQCGDESVER